MPGWILVANRFSFLTAFWKNGGLPSAVLSLACLVVLTGCSNLRQQSQELPLPVLPSQAAVEADQVDVPVSPLVEADTILAGSAVKDDSVPGSPSLENDFDTSFKKMGPELVPPPTTPSYLPTENDFQPPQLQARFVGVLDKAEMSEVKLKAVSSLLPAPAIGAAMKASTPENCKTPAVCNANASAQCDCCKKKQLPQLAVLEPINPEQLPELFGAGRALAKDKVKVSSLQPMLQPLRPANPAPEANVSQETNIASDPEVDSPIRLTAMQDSQIPKARLPLIADPIQTQNRAQLLFPLAPDKLKATKAEAKLVTTQTAKTSKANSTIKVSPVLDLVAAEASTGAVAMATVNEAVDSLAGGSKTKAEFIPVSSSGIRVSAVPFKPFSPVVPKPASVAAKTVVEPEQPTVIKKIVEPTLSANPVEVAKVFQAFEPQTSEAKASFADSMLNSNAFTPPLNKSIKAMPVDSGDFPVARTEVNEFSGPLTRSKLAPAKSAKAKLQSLAAAEFIEEEIDSFVVAPRSANIDPLKDLEGLPDMSQIEQELAEFKKENTFDPSTVIQGEKIDPAVLLAKLDGPPKKVAAPVVDVVETAPKNDLLTQQIAAQNSKLLEIRSVIEQFRPESAVTVVDEEPELTLNNAAFCTKISGFGQFTPFAANTFSGSQKTLLYCEVENQTSKRYTSFDGSDQFETVLHGAIVIYDANDQVVQTEKFPAIKDVARKQRRDFYVYFPVQFNELDSGDYRLELSVQDVAGNETAVLRPFMRFSVK